MKFVLSLVLLASSVGFATPASFQIDAPKYKAGVRCAGPIQGAEAIDFMQKPDGTYDLLLSGGGVTTGPFALKGASVNSVETNFTLVSTEPNVQVTADYDRKLSAIQIDIVPSGFSAGSVIRINTQNYTCNPLYVAQ